jgi:AhpD family alkylhydroperoxidase
MTAPGLMTARVELLAEHDAPLLARPFYGGGDPGPIVTAMAQVPELLGPMMAFIGPALGASAIDWPTKEIVILRTSAVMQCRYCVEAHTPVALDSGLAHDQVCALRAEAPIPDAFTGERERALVAWIDEVATGRGAVDDRYVDAMRPHFSDAELVELTVVIGATMLLNRFCTALALPTSPGTLERLAAEGFAR